MILAMDRFLGKEIDLCFSDKANRWTETPSEMEREIKTSNASPILIPKSQPGQQREEYTPPPLVLPSSRLWTS